jgi:nucleoside-diphosphate-sugar epimerase
VNKVLSGEILLVDDGKYPSNLVHVENFVEAILAAIRSENGWGERYFINDLGAITWKRFYEDLMRILCVDAVFSTTHRDEVMKNLRGALSSLGFIDNLKIMLSGEFRQCLSMVPIFKRLNDFAFGMFKRLNPELQKKLRKKLERPIVINKQLNKSKVDQLVKVQIRKIYHSPEKIMRELGYKPKVTYEEGMESTRRWMTFAGII